MGPRVPGIWTDEMRVRFANDPANLLAVAGQANQDKGDHEPAAWMPPNTAFHCQYAMQFIAVLRGYALPDRRAFGDRAAWRRDLPDG